jgi:hypothetical protein
MNIDEIYEMLSEKLVNTQLYQRAIKSTVEKELKQLSDYYERQKENPNRVVYKEGHLFYYQDLVSGEIQYYAQLQRSVKEVYSSVILHKNKQYEWLLVEAYEAFESFLEDSYAYLGFINTNAWPLSDFGNLQLNEISGKTIEWYKERVRMKKDKPKTILVQFRKIFPGLVEKEISNFYNVNMRLAVTTIELLRHIIVHKSGIVDNKKEFNRRILEKAELLQDKNQIDKYNRFINSFFASGEFENHISLLEIPAEKDVVVNFMYIDRFDVLVNYLMSYSGYIKKLIKQMSV